MDHNLLVMDKLQQVARQHNMAVLLHEKPFAGINGSGKHVNWSLSTDDGINLFKPGKTPHDNIQFLVFLLATMKAVHKHADILRAIGGIGGQRPPAGRQRGAAGDHLGLPGRTAHPDPRKHREGQSPTA